jgi:hypothetical protein
VGPSSHSMLDLSPGQVQSCHTRPHGCRRCLLKGCERWFTPARPQARYCSPHCQMAARRWRRWRASQRYRSTEPGKQRRRQQSQRYRQRQPPSPQPPADPPPPEGQRPARNPQHSAGCACDRPGCYDFFTPEPRCPDRRFCTPSCRNALRRVRQRELKLVERRRQRDRRRSPPSPPPPQGKF